MFANVARLSRTNESRQAPALTATAIVLAGVATLVPAALAGAAVAVTVAPVCYSAPPAAKFDGRTISDPIPATVTGLAPGQQVVVELDARLMYAWGPPVAVTADEAGEASATLTDWMAPARYAQLRTSSVIVRDASKKVLAKTPVRVATTRVTLDSQNLRDSSRPYWSITGLGVKGDRYYAHYLKRGKVVGTAKLGIAKDDCGSMAPVRRPRFPASLKNGTYVRVVQTSALYDPDREFLDGQSWTKRPIRR